jgi:hypothetical protein
MIASTTADDLKQLHVSAPVAPPPSFPEDRPYGGQTAEGSITHHRPPSRCVLTALPLSLQSDRRRACAPHRNISTAFMKHESAIFYRTVHDQTNCRESMPESLWLARLSMIRCRSGLAGVLRSTLPINLELMPTTSPSPAHANALRRSGSRSRSWSAPG